HRNSRADRRTRPNPCPAARCRTRYSTCSAGRSVQRLKARSRPPRRAECAPPSGLRNRNTGWQFATRWRASKTCLSREVSCWAENGCPGRHYLLAGSCVGDQFIADSRIKRAYQGRVLGQAQRALAAQCCVPSPHLVRLLKIACLDNKAGPGNGLWNKTRQQLFKRINQSKGG